MCPPEGLASDILVQQPRAQHQLADAPRPPPALVGAFVDDMAQIVETAGMRRLAVRQPFLAALAALPGARGKSENLNLDRAAFQRTGEDVGAHRRHGDRKSTRLNSSH